MTNTTRVSKLWDQLRGFAIVDGCVGTDVLCGVDLDVATEEDPTATATSGPGDYFFLEFFWGHNQISEKTYQMFMNLTDQGEPLPAGEGTGPCSMEELMGYGATVSSGCSDALATVRDELGGYWEYSLYDDCWY